MAISSASPHTTISFNPIDRFIRICIDCNTEKSFTEIPP
jgi:hypothetical protein